MFLKENVLLAVSGLKSNKMRSFLTMLGIIIGIGSVIGIVSIGQSLQQNVSEQMSSMGANSIYVYVAQRDNTNVMNNLNGDTGKMDDADLLTEEQIERVRQKFGSEISALSYWADPVAGKATKGHNYANVTIYGVTPDFAKVQNIKVDHGRFLQDRDIKGLRRVAVVSDRLVSNLFPQGVDPLGKTVEVAGDGGTDVYTVVGVYKYQATGMAAGNASEKDVRTELLVPVSVGKETAKAKNYASFEVQPTSVENAGTLTNELKAYMKNLYAKNVKYTCTVYNEENMLSTVMDIMGKISIAVAAIAGIALIVGGVGVMNIMLVSVTERTREIGTRKALGARSGYIRAQFIVEAVIICLLGGVIGILLGLLLAWAGASLLGFRLVLSLPIIFISVGFSMLIGVFFGYYPAKKASRLDPIEALRYE